MIELTGAWQNHVCPIKNQPEWFQILQSRPKWRKVRLRASIYLTVSVLLWHLSRTPAESPTPDSHSERDPIHELESSWRC